MTLGTNGEEQNRTKVGLAFLILGVVFLVWAWGSWAYRTATGPNAAVVEAGSANLQGDSARAVRALPGLVLAAGALALVFLFGSYFLRRFSRRYQEGANRQRGKPSEAEDVWAMHRTPNGDEDGPSDER